MRVLSITKSSAERPKKRPREDSHRSRGKHNVGGIILKVGNGKRGRDDDNDRMVGATGRMEPETRGRRRI